MSIGRGPSNLDSKKKKHIEGREVFSPVVGMESKASKNLSGEDPG
jgi:hypothetical protein